MRPMAHTGTPGEYWVAPPTVELRPSTEHQQDTPGPPTRLSEFVDFTAFGDRVDDQLTEMAVTITAPPRLAARSGGT